MSQQRHTYQLASAMSQLSQVLASGGRLVALDYNHTGPRMVAVGFLTEAARDRALAVTSRWCDGELMEQTMAARVLTAARQTE